MNASIFRFYMFIIDFKVYFGTSPVLMLAMIWCQTSNRNNIISIANKSMIFRIRTLKCLYNKMNASQIDFFIIYIHFNLYFGNWPVFMCIPVYICIPVRSRTPVSLKCWTHYSGKALNPEGHNSSSP